MLVPLEKPRRDASFERDVRFGDTINIQPVVQLMNRLRFMYEDLERSKKVLLREQNNRINALTELDKISVEAMAMADLLNRIRSECEKAK